MDNGASSYRRFLDGDEGAFSQIVADLFPGTVGFIDGFVRDYHTAQDIAMDVFADLIVHPGRYNFKVSLKTYIYMCARSRALDYLKHQRVIRFTQLEEALVMADGGQDPQSLLQRSELRRAVQKALEELPEPMAVAVYLVYFEDMTYAQAAKVLKRNVKYVDNILQRAKKELRRILGEDGKRYL